ncbi:MAG: hypothetical protein M1840_006712 [Geoglossum simile]|nr:MAG: hypothetical protein M1840_006712 [Geoglossum simile]
MGASSHDYQVTKRAIHYGGRVLLVPQESMVHFRNPSNDVPKLASVGRASPYAPGDRSLVLMKIQFSGNSNTTFGVYLINDSHKRDFRSGPAVRIDIAGGDECLFNGALQISYPRCIEPNGDHANTNYAMYFVGNEDFGNIGELLKEYRDRLAEVGGTETKVVIIKSFVNTEWV